MKANYIIKNECDHDFKSNNTYVYELHNPITNQPFYVGKGRDNRAQRHISLRKNIRIHNTNPHKSNTINQIIDSGNKVIIKIISTHSVEKDAFASEIQLIEQYGRRCNDSGILTNITAGGDGYTHDGISVNQHTMWGEFVATYKNAKEAMRINGWTNYSTICGCCMGKERSYKGFLWCYSTNQPILLSTAKPVYQWSVDGELLSAHRNTATAARLIGCDSSTIGAALQLRNNQNTYAAGFLWSHDKICPIYKPAAGLKKGVKNITTGVIYNSLTEAAADNNTTCSNISAVCNGKQKSTKGCYYCYIN